MNAIAVKSAIAAVGIILAGASATLSVSSAEAGPGRITKLSGTDLGSGR
jgi:hypothetical protein